MDMKSNIPDDHIGIFRNSLRKHGKKVTIYYDATEKGQLPTKTDKSGTIILAKQQSY